jgi:hypothetical protein
MKNSRPILPESQRSGPATDLLQLLPEILDR